MAVVLVPRFVASNVIEAVIPNLLSNFTYACEYVPLGGLLKVPGILTSSPAANEVAVADEFKSMFSQLDKSVGVEVVGAKGAVVHK